jgi:hypothetical protein
MASYIPQPSQTLPPVGTYLATFTSFSESVETLKDSAKLTFQGFTAEAIADADGEITFDKVTLGMSLESEDGKEIQAKETFTLTPKFGWKMGAVREALGFKDKEGDNIILEKDDFVGKTAHVKVTHRTGGNGTTYADFKWLKPKAGEVPF